MLISPYIREQVIVSRIDRNGVVTRTLVIKTCGGDKEHREIVEAAAEYMKGQNQIDQTEVLGPVELSRRAPHDFATVDRAQVHLAGAARPEAQAVRQS